jgi:MYXO-CTERM domain-containing protein
MSNSLRAIALLAAAALAACGGGGGSEPANKPPVAGLVISPASGAAPLAVTASGSTSTDPDGTISSWAWDFGDGGSAATASPSHAWADAGSYLVKLTVTDNDGASASDFTLVEVAAASADNDPPVAEVGPARSAVVAEVVSFDGSASSDSDGTIAAYAWDFGDGSTATGATAAHAFAAAGSYFVRLTVTDDDGATGEDYALVSIGGGGANTPPTAEAGADRSGETGASVAFDGSGSSDADGALIAYLWDYGDGSSGVGRTASHIYAAGGTYTATLTVIDNGGASATDTTSVTVVGAGGDDSGCGCRAGSRSTPGGLLLLLGLAALLLRRKP